MKLPEKGQNVLSDAVIHYRISTEGYMLVMVLKSLKFRLPWYALLDYFITKRLQPSELIASESVCKKYNVGLFQNVCFFILQRNENFLVTDRFDQFKINLRDLSFVTGRGEALFVGGLPIFFGVV